MIDFIIFTLKEYKKRKNEETLDYININKNKYKKKDCKKLILVSKSR
jgi:hypothetical protein